jgi:hypothetical protein
VALLAAVCVGCGKKGPPIAPIVHIPAPVDKIAAARLGNDAYVTLTVPDTNIDNSPRADLARIDVYGYTGTMAPTRVRWAELGTIVASIPVLPPPSPDDPPPPPPAQRVTADGAMQGAIVTIRDHLDAGKLAQGKLAPVDPRALKPITVPVVGPPVPLALKRFYLAIPFNTRGRPGPPGAQTEFVLTTLPDPPESVRAVYNAGTVALAWEQPGGLLGFLIDKPLPPEPTPFDLPVPGTQPATVAVEDTAVPPGPTSYNVYREVAPDVFALPAPRVGPWATPPPVPLNPAPLSTTVLTDMAEFGREACYSVRARRGTVISEPSMRTCLTPVDIFPPAAPVGLAAVPSEGGISLIWEPNSDADLGGYLVLRRDPGDATLRQLTDTPIREARYRDTTVQPGSRYVYSVVAVDSQLPLPNMSAESMQVEETAR